MREVRPGTRKPTKLRDPQDAQQSDQAAQERCTAGEKQQGWKDGQQVDDRARARCVSKAWKPAALARRQLNSDPKTSNVLDEENRTEDRFERSEG
jgi:hypothetical protein